MWIISKRVGYEHAIVVAIRTDKEAAVTRVKELAEAVGPWTMSEGIGYSDGLFVDCGEVDGEEIGFYVTKVEDAR